MDDSPLEKGESAEGHDGVHEWRQARAPTPCMISVSLLESGVIGDHEHLGHQALTRLSWSAIGMQRREIVIIEAEEIRALAIAQSETCQSAFFAEPAE
jgi:hypothetical protein